MRSGPSRRFVRWVGGILAVLMGVVTLAVTARLVPAYIADRSLSNKSGYLGTILSAVSFLVLLIQFLRGLGRRERSAALAERLQPEIRSDLDRRIAHMRRTPEDISLTYWSVAQESEVTLDALTQALLREHARIVVTAHPGRGKSYSALRIAQELVSGPSAIVPLVIPLSRWTEDEEIVPWLCRFIAIEFRVSEPAARELVDSGSLLPLFDGLDELCRDEDAVLPAERFLERVIAWQLAGTWAPFLLTCRRATWNVIREDLRNHHTLRTHAVLPVRYADATTYLSRYLGGTDTFQPAMELALALRAAERDTLQSNPWQLSMVAELARQRMREGLDDAGNRLATVAESVDTESLVARYVESVSAVDGFILRRMRNVLDLWWLSNYAKYLERNRYGQHTVADRVLPARDIVLHRLWPAAGRRSPLVVDFVMCVLLSIPGFVWGSQFLWSRGWIARICLLVGGAVWSAMLFRTSTKPWVRAATPDWSRLTRPRFFVRQMAAALAIGAAAWLVLGPLVALVGFVTAWLAIGLTVGFGQTLAVDTRREIVGPLGVLRQERQVSQLSAAAVFPALAWGFSVTWGPLRGVIVALAYCVVVGETVACALWRRYLAMIIASTFRLPPAPARCLQRMCKVGFLRVAGVAYQFRHDDILRYFAVRYDVRAHLLRARRRIAHPDRSARSLPVE